MASPTSVSLKLTIYLVIGLWRKEKEEGGAPAKHHVASVNTIYVHDIAYSM